MGDVIDGRLRELGHELAAPKAPVANYLGTKRSGDLLFVSGRVSRTRGEVGTDLSTDSAREAARDTMLDLLSIIKNDIGRLSKITSIEKLNGFVRSSPEFTEQPLVVDGASDLLIALWGDAGRHARTATGVAQLPFGAAVQLELVVRLGSDA
jgi:enamine deaminase RidA (YjgF/YER057c/UK114 family)